MPSEYTPDEYDIHARQPEEMGVGKLNNVVRELREALYQQRLRAQAADERRARACSCICHDDLDLASEQAALLRECGKVLLETLGRGHSQRCWQLVSGAPCDCGRDGRDAAIRALLLRLPASDSESEEKREEWNEVPEPVRHWIINTLLHPTATGLGHPSEEHQYAARVAINLLAKGTGYALATKPQRVLVLGHHFTRPTTSNYVEDSCSHVTGILACSEKRSAHYAPSPTQDTARKETR